MPPDEKPGRWAGAKIERYPHPLDDHHQPHASLERVARAEANVRDCIERIGYAELLWVAEQLAFEFGVGYWEGRLIISLTDLQLVAFSAALRAHREVMYPAPPKKNNVSKSQKSKKRR